LQQPYAVIEWIALMLGLVLHDLGRINKLGTTADLEHPSEPMHLVTSVYRGYNRVDMDETYICPIVEELAATVVTHQKQVLFIMQAAHLCHCLGSHSI
jgi:hypothetical protein